MMKNNTLIRKTLFIGLTCVLLIAASACAVPASFEAYGMLIPFEHSPVSPNNTDHFFGVDIYGKGELTCWDFEEAYLLCKTALITHYLALWNDGDIDYGRYIENANLLHYMSLKMQKTRQTLDDHLSDKSRIDNIFIGLVQQEVRHVPVKVEMS